MTDMFDDPAAGVKITQFENALLLVKPHGIRNNIVTPFGEADATEADISVLDGPNAGEEHPGCLVFQKALQGQLRPSITTGRMVLGRLGRGAAKPGQDPPWILGDPTEADKTLAREHLAKATATASPPF